MAYFNSLTNGVIRKKIYKLVGSINNLPSYGFKIHISSEPLTAQELLNIVEAYCIENELTYKYIFKKEDYYASLKKDFDRFSSGKFITIYPPTEFIFKKALYDLNELLGEKYKGPYILSDKQYSGSSTLYYRYGRMKEEAPYKITNNGKFYIDNNRSLYELPDWIEEPFPVVDNQESNYLLKTYKIEKCIHLSNTGGVYLGVNKNNEKYIIKEARPYVGYSANLKDDSVVYRKNEFNNFNNMSNLLNVPKTKESFFDSGHFFTVVEYINGYTLFDIFENNNLLNHYLPTKEKKEEFLFKLIEQVKCVHKINFYIGDISSVNIMYNKNDNKLYFIDLEYSGFGESTTYTENNTPGFKVKSDKLNVFEQDIQSLALTFASMFFKDREEVTSNTNLIKYHLRRVEKLGIITYKTYKTLLKMIFEPGFF
ncbi:TPA: serine/threonine protein kinase [Staphylococcus pseudintermedius]|nr:serine/threonine protein kinase [Staphylococcus pseudintermedius]HAR6591412.1 serine/threonine protein kinase [Staphylococcus pseudintermedius]